jgi:glutathione peroxidase
MTRRFASLAALALLALLAGPQAPARGAESGAHAFSFVDIDGGELPLAQFAGRPMLVVNTASMCAFTPQYEGLQALWERYRDRGLVVIGVSSDSFNQELASEDKVRDFCTVNYGIDFPMTAITAVRGPDAHPFYAWAARAPRSGGAPRWNFHKFLIDGEGRMVAGFGSGVGPNAPQLIREIERLLPGS